MKTRALIPFLFALHSICGAQQAPDDLFPLVVGQKWSYDFALSYSWTLAKYSQRDTGTVSCQITQKLESTDSTIWRFIQIRDYTQWRWANYTNYGPTHYCDTTTFDLVEMNSGSHRLHLFTPDWRAAFGHTMFPLWKDYPSSVVDSSQFYRFASVDSASGLSLNIAVQGPYSSNRSLRFQKGTGVVTSSGSAYNSNSESWQWRYWNCTFTKTYTGSHLNVPRHISYAGFTNYHSDTTIALISNGTEPTTILGITTSDPLLVVSLPTNIVPPVGTIPLTLRHQSPPEGSSSYQMIIVSDSPTSPDTIDVTINARTESVLHLSGRWFNYDKVWFSQRPFIANLMLANTGNTPIQIDSLRATSEYLTWRLDHALLQPGDSALCRIEYVPNPTQFSYPDFIYGSLLTRHQDTLFIFSNATSSPDTVRLSADVLGGTVRFSTHSLSFTSDVPGTAAALITISVGHPEMVIRRSQPSNPSFRTTQDLDLQLGSTNSYTDTIFFVPRRGGESRGFVLYYTHSTLFGTDIIPAVDTVWLYGDARPSRAFIDSVVDFGKVPPGVGIHKNYFVSNAQNRPQTVERLPLSVDSPFSFSSALHTTLAPYSSMEDTIHFRSHNSGPYAARVCYVFTEEGGGTHSDSILLSATVTTAVCSLGVSQINFGIIAPGQRERTTLTLTNTVSTPLIVHRRILSPHSPFVVLGQDDIHLQPLASVQDTLGFAPDSVGTFSGDVQYVFSYDSLVVGMDSVRLFATAISSFCSINEHLVDFGTAVIGQTIRRSITLTSGVALPFSVQRHSTYPPSSFSFIAPNDIIVNPFSTVQDTLLFAGTSGGTFSDVFNYLCFFEGAQIGCDTIHLRATVTPVFHLISERVLDYGSIAQGQTKTLIVALVSTIDSWQQVARLPLPSNEGFSAVVRFSKSLPPHGTLLDTISAISEHVGMHSVYVYYQFSRGGSFTSIDSVLLRCEVLPAVYSLGQNYPNPFNSTTTITLDIPEATKGTVDVFDVLGKQVQVLMDGPIEPGRHILRYSADHLATGIYIYRLRTSSTTLSRKMVLIR